MERGMESVRGSRSVRLERKKGDLGFSIKGGSEHGIPIVVSNVERNGPAASCIRLGDEILSVNGVSLQGVSHREAVNHLRTIRGQSIILHLRSNPILQDTFTCLSTTSQRQPSRPDVNLDRRTSTDWEGEKPDDNPLPLPQGWQRKVDHKTDRPYFENHYTKTSTWTDPRSLSPRPLSNYNWEALPTGWEKFVDQHGDIYYVDHDTQTTLWDSPRGLREQEQLQELQKFLTEGKSKLKEKQEKLKEKRALLLDKNEELENHKSSLESHDATSDDEEILTDIIDDIMVLNEETEELENIIHKAQYQLQELNEILAQAQSEEMGETNPHKAAAIIAADLQRNVTEFKELSFSINMLIFSLEELRHSEHLDETPISYMLQLQPTGQQTKEEITESTEWIHVLGDRLTGKTNVEMRVENLVLVTLLPAARLSVQQVTDVCTAVKETRVAVDWDSIVEQLVSLDLSVFKEDWLASDNFKEKLLKMVDQNL